MDVYDGAAQLEKLYNDKKLKETLGAIGVKKVEKYYDWEKVAETWDKLIRNKVMEL